MAVGSLDTNAHALVGLALRQLAHDRPDGEIALFSAVLKAWLDWAGAMHCPTCERQLIDSAQDELAAARQQCLH